MNLLINASMSTLIGKIWACRNMRATCARYAAVPLRLIVGYGFLAHGIAKWHSGPEAFAAILHAIGVPAPQVMAWLTIATEILSGLAFLIGGFVSLVSIPSIILLAVAVFTVHLPYGFSSIKLLGVSNGMAQFGPPGYECDLLYIASIVVLLLIGPTPWSVDNYRLLGERRRNQHDLCGISVASADRGDGPGTPFPPGGLAG